MSGLWHGANWTFVIWGALNGLYLIASIASAGARRSLVEWTNLRRVPYVHKALRLFLTFHLILISWVFFRAASAGHAVTMLHAMATARPGLPLPFESIGGKTVVMICILSLLASEWLQMRTRIGAFLSSRPAVVRWPAYVTLATMFLLLADFVSEQQFIYFQF